MILRLTLIFAFLCSFHFANAQTGNVVLIEQFTETGCGACSQYDSAFQAMIRANSEKVAVINYHCFYKLDTFYTYNRSCDVRYGVYAIKDGYPTAIANGKKPGVTSAHMSFVKESVINKFYEEPPKFKIEITKTPDKKIKGNNEVIKIKATPLEESTSKDIRIFVAITENNINYFERYKTKTPNGLNYFDNIIRAMLPDTGGFQIGPIKSGKAKEIKVTYINDDKEVNFKETKIIAFVQDMETKEILGTSVLK
jgi:hypothetical protein